MKPCVFDRRCLARIAFSVLVSFSAAVGAPVGPAVTYQGALKDNGAPFNGTVSMEFRLYDAQAGGMLIGTQSIPTVTCTNGLFTVQLNDANQFGSSAFNGDARWLEIWVNGIMLTPRQPLTTAPYAQYALKTPWGSLVGVPAGFADGIDNGSTLDQAYREGGPGAGRTINADAGAVEINGAGGLSVAGRIASGVAAPAARVDVSSSSEPGVQAVGNWISILGKHNVSSGTFPGVQGETDSTSNGASGVRGIVNSTTPGDLSSGVRGLNNGTGALGVGVFGSHAGSGHGVHGTTPGGIGVYGEATGSSGTNYGVWGQTASPAGYAGYFQGRGYFSGNVGIGQSDPTAPLDIYRNSFLSGPVLRTTQPGFLTQASWTLELGASNINAYGTDSSGNAIDRTLLLNDHSSGDIVMATGGGFVGIGRSNRIGAEYFGVRAPVGDNSFGGMYMETSSASGWPFYGYATNGSIRAYHYLNGATGDWNLVNGGTRLTVKSNGNVGIGTTTPTQKLEVNGTARVSVLEISGADVAEKFPASDKPSPGTVMEIDPEHPGQIRIARGAYNPRVAGVVSGANDFPAGAILGNKPGHEDATPIALSGRVYVQCDATHAAIAIGDLLTTSDLAGYAMKAADRERAYGAIIGKAMTSLERGKTGMVLVLVSLQ